MFIRPEKNRADLNTDYNLPEINAVMCSIRVAMRATLVHYVSRKL